MAESSNQRESTRARVLATQLRRWTGILRCVISDQLSEAREGDHLMIAETLLSPSSMKIVQDDLPPG